MKSAGLPAAFAAAAQPFVGQAVALLEKQGKLSAGIEDRDLGRLRPSGSSKNSPGPISTPNRTFGTPSTCAAIG